MHVDNIPQDSHSAAPLHYTPPHKHKHKHKETKKQNFNSVSPSNQGESQTQKRFTAAPSPLGLRVSMPVTLQQEEPVHLKRAIFEIGTNAVHGLSATERQRRVNQWEPNKIIQHTTRKHVYKIDKAIYECCKLIHMSAIPKPKPSRSRRLMAISHYIIKLRYANIGAYGLLWALALSVIGAAVDKSVPSSNVLNAISLAVYMVAMLLARCLYVLFVHKKSLKQAMLLTIRPTVIPFCTFVRANGYQDVFPNVGDNSRRNEACDNNGNYDFNYMFDLFLSPSLERGTRTSLDKGRHKRGNKGVEVSGQSRGSNLFISQTQDNNSLDMLNVIGGAGCGESTQSNSGSSGRDIIRIKDSFRGTKNITGSAHLIDNSRGASSHNSVQQYGHNFEQPNGMNGTTALATDFYSIVSSNTGTYTFGASMEQINNGMCDILVDDVITQVRCSEIIPGDVVVLGSGDVVPSDCMLLPIIIICGVQQSQSSGGIHNNRDVIVLTDMIRSVTLVGFSDYSFGAFIESYIARPDDRKYSSCSYVPGVVSCGLRISDFVHKRSKGVWGEPGDGCGAEPLIENSILSAPSFTLLAGMTIKSIQLNCNSKLEIKDPKTSVKVLAVTTATGHSLLINQFIELFDVITNIHTINDLEMVKPNSADASEEGGTVGDNGRVIDETKINLELTTRMSSGLSLINTVLNSKSTKVEGSDSSYSTSSYTDCQIGSSVDCASEGSPLLAGGDVSVPRLGVPPTSTQTPGDSSIRSPEISGAAAKVCSSLQTGLLDDISISDIRRPAPKRQQNSVSDTTGSVPFLFRDNKAGPGQSGAVLACGSNKKNKSRSGTQSPTASDQKCNISSQNDKRINEKILRINKELEEAIAARQKSITEEQNKNKRKRYHPRYLESNLFYSARTHNLLVYRTLYILSLLSCIALPFVPLIYNIYNNNNLDQGHTTINVNFEGKYILSCYMSVFAIFFVTLSTRYDNPISLSLYNTVCSSFKRYLIDANKRLRSLGKYEGEQDMEDNPCEISAAGTSLEQEQCASTTMTNEGFCGPINQSFAFSDAQSGQFNSTIRDSVRSNRPLLSANSAGNTNGLQSSDSGTKPREKGELEEANSVGNNITLSNILAMNNVNALVIDVSRLIDAVEINRIFSGFTQHSNSDSEKYRKDTEAYCDSIILKYYSRRNAKEKGKGFAQMTLEEDPFAFYDYNDKLGLISETRNKLQHQNDRQLSWLHSHISNNRNMLLLVIYATLTPKERYMLYKIYVNDRHQYPHGIAIQKPDLTPAEKTLGLCGAEIDINFSILLRYSSFSNVVTIFNIISNRTYGNFPFLVHDIVTYPMHVCVHVVSNTTYYKRRQTTRGAHSRTQSAIRSPHETGSLSTTSSSDTMLFIAVRSPTPHLLKFCRFYIPGDTTSTTLPFARSELTDEVREMVQRDFEIESEITFENIFYAYYFGPIQDADIMFFDREQMAYGAVGPKKIQFDISKYPLIYLGHAFGIIKPNIHVAGFMDKIYGDSSEAGSLPTHKRAISLVLHSRHNEKHSRMILRTLRVTGFFSDQELHRLLRFRKEQERDKPRQSGSCEVSSSSVLLGSDAVCDEEQDDSVVTQAELDKLITTKATKSNKDGRTESPILGTNTSGSNESTNTTTTNNNNNNNTNSNTGQNIIKQIPADQLEMQEQNGRWEREVDEPSWPTDTTSSSRSIFETAQDPKNQECFGLLLDAPESCKAKMAIRNRNIHYLRLLQAGGAVPFVGSSGDGSGGLSSFLTGESNKTSSPRRRRRLSGPQYFIPRIFTSGITQHEHSLPTYNNQRKCMIIDYNEFGNRENLGFFFSINEANNSKTSKIDNFLIALVVNTPSYHNLYEVTNGLSNAIIVENRPRGPMESYDDERDYGNIVFLPPNKSKYSVENNYRSSLMLLSLLDIIFEAQFHTAAFAILSNYINKVNITINSLPIFNLIVVLFGVFYIEGTYTMPIKHKVEANSVFVYNSIFLVAFVLVTRLIFQQVIPLIIERILPNQSESKVKKLVGKLRSIRGRPYGVDGRLVVSGEGMLREDEVLHCSESGSQSVSEGVAGEACHTYINSMDDIGYTQWMGGSGSDGLGSSAAGAGSKNNIGNDTGGGVGDECCGENCKRCVCCKEATMANKKTTDNKLLYRIQHMLKDAMDRKFNVRITIIYLVLTITVYVISTVYLSSDAVDVVSYRYLPAMAFKAISSLKFAFLSDDEAFGDAGVNLDIGMGVDEDGCGDKDFGCAGERDSSPITIENGEQSTRMLLLLFTVGTCTVIQLLIITVNTFVKVYVMDFIKIWQRADDEGYVSSYDKSKLRLKYSFRKFFVVLMLIFGVSIIYFGLCIIYPFGLAIWGGNVPGSGLTAFDSSQGSLILVVIAGEIVKEAVYSIKEFKIMVQ